MSLTECQQTRRLCIELKRFNCTCLTLHGGDQYQRPGMPDRIIIHRSFPGPLWVEFKADAGKLSGAQRQFIAEIRGKGCRACVCRFGSVCGSRKGTIEDENGEILMNWDGTPGGFLGSMGTLIHDKRI